MGRLAKDLHVGKAYSPANQEHESFHKGASATTLPLHLSARPSFRFFRSAPLRYLEKEIDQNETHHESNPRGRYLPACIGNTVPRHRRTANISSMTRRNSRLAQQPRRKLHRPVAINPRPKHALGHPHQLTSRRLDDKLDHLCPQQPGPMCLRRHQRL